MVARDDVGLLAAGCSSLHHDLVKQRCLVLVYVLPAAHVVVANLAAEFVRYSVVGGQVEVGSIARTVVELRDLQPVVLDWMQIGSFIALHLSLPSKVSLGFGEYLEAVRLTGV